MPSATVNGTELFYELRGEGPALLTMHGGLGFDHTYMARSFAPLEERFTVIYYDQRHNGRSGRPPLETLTMEQLADDAAALLDVLGFETATVLGHSYGGFVAQEFAIRHPDGVRSLVLVDTTPGQRGENESADETEQGPPLPEEFVQIMSEPPASDAEMRAGLPTMMRMYLHKVTPEDVAHVVEATEFNAAAMLRGFEVLAHWSSVDRLHGITAPTLLLWGKHDLVCSLPQSGRIARRIPGAERHVFEDSGHFPWLEEPEAFFRELLGWLERRG